MVTVNQAKSLGAVNGAQGAYLKRVRAVLLMQLACGRVVPVHLTRHPGTGELVYPVVLAFSCTVHKVQGSTVLQDIVIWPDLKHEVIARNFPGWLYVAVTRAQRWTQLSFLTPVTSALTHRAHTGKRRI
jgi:ATP-dependent exoDNAse (exonuclease V) alpha subunit